MPLPLTMKQEATILIVDDDQDILVAGKLLLKRYFSRVVTCEQPEQIPVMLGRQKYDAILLDMNFGPGESSGKQGYSWLQKILDLEPQAVVIMITAHGGIDVAVEAMKLGATDFIAKPWQNAKMVATISAAVKLGQSRMEISELKKTNKLLAEVSAGNSHQRLLGSSPAMRQVMSLIERAAPTDANVMILGENGTGKELVAREIHHRSHRSDSVFMSIDLGALSENLFESELFGHKKGAFTGAKDDRVGRFQAADGGTLFLDEIGNLPLHLQAKLLTVLEQRMVTPIGANQAIPFNVRVIAATNISKGKLNDESEFRQDLLFRLNTVEVNLPPLRERKADIYPIAKFYVEHYSQKYSKSVKPFSNDALETIENYAWPGNVRALRHAIERAVILSVDNEFSSRDFQLELPPNRAGDSVSQPLDRSINSKGKFDPESNEINTSVIHEKLNLEELEKKAISIALKKHRYNISHSAKELGLTRAALYRRMEKHGL